LITDLVLEALRNVEPTKVQLSRATYDGRPAVTGPKYQERTFAYEFYHQLRLLQESGREDLQGITQQAEVSKRYQGIPYSPDLLLHVPGQTANLAAFEFKLATNLDLNDDLFKLQHLKADYGYRNAFMIVLGGRRAADRWLEKARGFQSSNGEEIDFIIYGPQEEERVCHAGRIRVDVPRRRHRSGY